MPPLATMNETRVLETAPPLAHMAPPLLRIPLRFGSGFPFPSALMRRKGREGAGHGGEALKAGLESQVSKGGKLGGGCRKKACD